MSEQALPCIVCDIPLKNVFAKETINQPSGGAMFTSTGNYGSTVWDNVMAEMYLMVNICDECLKAKAAEQKIFFNQTRRLVVAPGGKYRGSVIGYERVERELVPWNPDVRYEDGEDAIVVESIEDFERLSDMRTRFGHHKVVWSQGIDFARRIVENDLKEQEEMS